MCSDKFPIQKIKCATPFRQNPADVQQNVRGTVCFVPKTAVIKFCTCLMIVNMSSFQARNYSTLITIDPFTGSDAILVGGRGYRQT